MAGQAIGTMREWIAIESSTPRVRSITSLTAAGVLATATTAGAHGFAAGDFVTVAGATPAGFNGTHKIAVPSTATFTFPVASGLSSPAAGAMTVLYVRDGQGGRARTWWSVDTVAAELVTARAGETMRAGSIGADTRVQFRVRVHPDLTPRMRVRWTPSWPPGAPEQVLEILGIPPLADGRTWALLECGVWK